MMKTFVLYINVITLFFVLILTGTSASAALINQDKVQISICLETKKPAFQKKDFIFFPNSGLKKSIRLALSDSALPFKYLWDKPYPGIFLIRAIVFTNLRKEKLFKSYNVKSWYLQNTIYIRESFYYQS